MGMQDLWQKKQRASISFLRALANDQDSEAEGFKRDILLIEKEIEEQKALDEEELQKSRQKDLLLEQQKKMIIEGRRKKAEEEIRSLDFENFEVNIFPPYGCDTAKCGEIFEKLKKLVARVDSFSASNLRVEVKEESVMFTYSKLSHDRSESIIVAKNISSPSEFISSIEVIENKYEPDRSGSRSDDPFFYSGKSIIIDIFMSLGDLFYGRIK